MRAGRIGHALLGRRLDPGCGPSRAEDLVSEQPLQLGRPRGLRRIAEQSRAQQPGRHCGNGQRVPGGKLAEPIASLLALAKCLQARGPETWSSARIAAAVSAFPAAARQFGFAAARGGRDQSGNGILEADRQERLRDPSHGPGLADRDELLHQVDPSAVVRGSCVRAVRRRKRGAAPRAVRPGLHPRSAPSPPASTGTVTSMESPSRGPTRTVRAPGEAVTVAPARPGSDSCCSRSGRPAR